MSKRILVLSIGALCLLPTMVGTKPPEEPYARGPYYEASYPSKPISKFEPLVPIKWEPSDFLASDWMPYTTRATLQYAVVLEAQTRLWLKADQERYWLRYDQVSLARATTFVGPYPRVVLRVLVPASFERWSAAERMKRRPPICSVFAVTLHSTPDELSHWMDVQVGWHTDIRPEGGKLKVGDHSMAVAISISDNIPMPADLSPHRGEPSPDGIKVRSWRDHFKGNAYIYPRYDIFQGQSSYNQNAYFLFWQGNVNWLKWLEDGKHDEFYRKFAEEMKCTESPGIEMVPIYKYIDPPMLNIPELGEAARDADALPVPATTHERVCRVFVRKNSEPKQNEPAWYWGVLVMANKNKYQFIRKGANNWEVFDMMDKPVVRRLK